MVSEACRPVSAVEGQGRLGAQTLQGVVEGLEQQPAAEANVVQQHRGDFLAQDDKIVKVDRLPACAAHGGQQHSV